MTTQTIADAIDQNNVSTKQPVIFIHGLWLKPSSWDRWAEMFEAAGYAALAPCWPAEVGGAMAPETVGEVTAHFAGIAEALGRRPALIGHSFGGLIAQILAGRGLSAATVAIDPAPFRGVLPLPMSALRSAWPVLHNPANAAREVGLTSEQFRYAFGNAVPEPESEALYQAYQAPAPGRPIFQAAVANLNPWTEVRVDTEAAQRGPLLMISGERDHTVPPSVARAAYDQQKRNRQAITEFVQLPGRGHSLTIDSGWREVAETALRFVKRFL
ncbi:alpha/beta hydrolase [Bradyrhizobium sp. U87765 SZCCT0131]|uniref:alpha/beta hydrolase n=1 Tax=unclassified Bradyrhizobium TaxID=2631580 RepID=UPI001BAAEDD4|nr:MULTISPECIES: alpha/beta hydrolase [unclassified Bradyrhizobium]MBR1216611.1 alpha/beta hydrolase [Bradyrhizobium sp. U87765 SZCCT0131]MBR1259633.1 alpha/beta hydrolase [Bradyrhizobium sp. U87765 SZCCT0134]MBR1305774.1 alpha/beta hydrolase [Bradyrhizobium sp. U87765 SZCCT0110]MBR1322141.1 alpha/beta hydrolase [Bradyrhizobium sp. U87765 SZCCT0109]MBR1350581.1 alpha/beta hydrolase [Bradyrhizobium sp. U87765 SZCCT0048]